MALSISGVMLAKKTWTVIIHSLQKGEYLSQTLNNIRT